MGDRVKVQRALLSVYDKTGLVEFAQRLVSAGVELISSGGTHAVLQQSGLPVRAVEDVTGAPEMLGGRVKTLHPSIHGGILADRGVSDHLEDLDRRGIAPIDLVVSNLYPFEDTAASGATPDEVIDLLDVAFHETARPGDTVSRIG